MLGWKLKRLPAVLNIFFCTYVPRYTILHLLYQMLDTDYFWVLWLVFYVHFFGISEILTVIIKTQAGTYIKEFVHGDLGRTHPRYELFVQLFDSLSYKGVSIWILRLISFVIYVHHIRLKAPVIMKLMLGSICHSKSERHKVQWGFRTMSMLWDIDTCH